MSKIDVDCSIFDLEKLWEQRQKAIEDEENSLKEWEKLDADQRTAVEDLITQALDKMRADLSWIPYSLELQQGSCIDVRVRMLFSDISDEIIKRRAEEHTQILEAKGSTEKMVKELSAKGPNVTALLEEEEAPNILKLADASIKDGKLRRGE